MCELSLCYIVPRDREMQNFSEKEFLSLFSWDTKGSNLYAVGLFGKIVRYEHTACLKLSHGYPKR